jgi:hypothetical protein
LLGVAPIGFGHGKLRPRFRIVQLDQHRAALDQLAVHEPDGPDIAGLLGIDGNGLVGA